MKYDRIIQKTIEEETVTYGIVFGNENVVFIKTGAGGNIRGHKEKYLKMAHRIHGNTGATVICASNPDTDHEELDQHILSMIAEEKKFSEYKVHLIGTSDGAYKVIQLAKALPQAVELLAINTSSVSFDDMGRKLLQIPRIKKILVYGTEDDEYHYVSRLKELNCDNLRIEIVEGADHQFHRMLEEYISLVDLLML